MTLQLAVSTRNARLDAIETDAGTAAILKIRTGAQPADCATADSGTVLATLTLPSDWMAAASAGAKAKSGTWQDASADAAGTAGHFRLYKSDGTTCIMQGSVTATGGGGDLTLDNTNIAAAQSITITSFTITVVELVKYSLGAGEQLIYMEGVGWSVIDASGNIKTSGVGTGRLLRSTIYTSGSAATHNFMAGCLTAVIEVVGGGGGGGGASFSSPNMGFGAGGASGGYCRKSLANPGATATYTVGGGGSAGANTGGTGGTGSDSTVQVGATTYTAKGGLGGVGLAAGSTLIVVAGGAGVLGTNGDLNLAGEPGGNGVRLSGLLGGSGAGGSGILGGGGVGKTANAAGAAGANYGGGGGGAAAVSASQLGGAGAGGVIIITEYS